MKSAVFTIALLHTVSAFAPTKTSDGFATAIKADASATEASAMPSKPMFDEFLDEEAMLSESNFPIKPDDLMTRARYILSDKCGIGTKDGGECLAEEFEFCAAVVGPIGRKEYLGALDSFSLEDAFDITPRFFGMTVDPLQPNRVWFFNRVKGIHKGEFMGAKPDGKEIIYPPQILHMDLNEDGKVTEFGFYTADRRQGNTGGLGGAFGFMYGVGKPLPIPECAPYKQSFRFRMLNKIGSLARKMQRNKEQ